MKTSYTNVYHYTTQSPLLWFAVVVFLVLTVAHAGYVYSTRFTRTITVDRTFTGVEGESVSPSMTSVHTSYNVVDDTGEMFEVVNSPWLWSWDKTNVWGSLKPGKKYRIHGFGKYVGMLDWYPSIVHVTEV
jgi:hypothetical protein